MKRDFDHVVTNQRPDELPHGHVVRGLSGEVGHAESEDSLIESSFRLKSWDDLLQAQLADTFIKTASGFEAMQTQARMTQDRLPTSLNKG